MDSLGPYMKELEISLSQTAQEIKTPTRLGEVFTLPKKRKLDNTVQS